MIKTLFIIMVFMFPFSAVAQEVTDTDMKQEYLKILPEVPLMDNLYEVIDSMLVFDKPDGRISEIIYFSDSISLEDAESYYTEILPQLGWVMSDKVMIFAREEEVLTVFASKNEEELIVKFSISPYKNPIKK